MNAVPSYSISSLRHSSPCKFKMIKIWFYQYWKCLKNNLTFTKYFVNWIKFFQTFWLCFSKLSDECLEKKIRFFSFCIVFMFLKSFWILIEKLFPRINSLICRWKLKMSRITIIITCFRFVSWDLIKLETYIIKTTTIKISDFLEIKSVGDLKSWWHTLKEKLLSYRLSLEFTKVEWPPTCSLAISSAISREKIVESQNW